MASRTNIKKILYWIILILLVGFFFITALPIFEVVFAYLTETTVAKEAIETSIGKIIADASVFAKIVIFIIDVAIPIAVKSMIKEHESEDEAPRYMSIPAKAVSETTAECSQLTENQRDILAWFMAEGNKTEQTKKADEVEDDM